jgi:hypothetical protein
MTVAERDWVSTMEQHWNPLAWNSKQQWYARILEQYREAQLAPDLSTKEARVAKLEKDAKVEKEQASRWATFPPDRYN